MGTSTRTIRGLLALGLVVGLAAAACSAKSAASGVPVVPGVNAGGTGSLASGLSGNLATLDSYQFSWSFSSASSTATSASTGSFKTSGIVINKPTKAYKIDNLGMLQVIVIGDKGWMSYDNGSTWTPDTTYTSGSSSLDSLLPDSLYGTNFDSNAAEFTVAGSENKNGIDCVHYTGSSSLGALGALAGVNATFKSDLWVAKSGNYPVSGFYGWTAASGGEAGSWGYQFDVTNVNDSANKVDPPTNVQALPSY
jgi:outer membrane lipoprotein-sorting protein